MLLKRVFFENRGKEAFIVSFSQGNTIFNIKIILEQFLANQSVGEIVFVVDYFLGGGYIEFSIQIIFIMKGK